MDNTRATHLCNIVIFTRNIFFLCISFEKFSFGMLIVSTGGIQWLLWFSVRYAAAHRETFGVNALR